MNLLTNDSIVICVSPTRPAHCILYTGIPCVMKVASTLRCTTANTIDIYYSISRSRNTIFELTNNREGRAILLSSVSFHSEWPVLLSVSRHLGRYSSIQRQVRSTLLVLLSDGVSHFTAFPPAFILLFAFAKATLHLIFICPPLDGQGRLLVHRPCWSCLFHVFCYLFFVLCSLLSFLICPSMLNGFS